MYIALFMSPWVLVYTLSTLVMNHREHLRSLYGAGPPVFENIGERSYTPVFPPEMTQQQKAIQILRDLDMDGSHSVTKPGADGTLTITRHDPVKPKRVIYRPVEGAVTVQAMVFTMPTFLERMHRRRGFQQAYATDDVWAFSVDLFIVAMIFWVASGLWMWWEMRVTRRWGALFALSGVGLFALFMATI